MRHFSRVLLATLRLLWLVLIVPYIIVRNTIYIYKHKKAYKRRCDYDREQFRYYQPYDPIREMAKKSKWMDSGSSEGAFGPFGCFPGRYDSDVVRGFPRKCE